MYYFRDPIHGFIEVSDDEIKIINSPPFQRLRNIRQLATTYLVYHGAEHSRFGHSLGVMHLVTRAFDSVVKKCPNLFSEDNRENETKILWYRQILRLIGLTHDLGHAPFSHASEDLFQNGPNNKPLEHEDYTRRIILETEISEYISEIGAKFQAQYGDQYEISPELIINIYEGNVIFRDNYNITDFLFLKSFMDSELDCDKMDYLLRDSKFCGVTYGLYDLERFISTLTVYKSDGHIQLAIEKGGIQALEEFILARYFMFIQVYFHKTRRYLDKCLATCLSKILPDGKFPLDIKEYLSWDDTKVLYLISQSEDIDIIKYRTREIMTCVYESHAHSYHRDALCNIKIISNIINKEFGQANLMYDSVDKAAHKLSPSLISYNDDSGKGIVIIDEKTSIPQNIMDVSLILKSIIEPISIKRIYAKKEISDEVMRRIKQLQS